MIELNLKNIELEKEYNAKKQEKTCVYQKFLLILRGILGRDHSLKALSSPSYDGLRFGR